MRKVMVGLLALALHGCGPPYLQDGYMYVCPSKCFAMVESKRNIDCKKYSDAEALALQMLPEVGMPPADETCKKILSNVTVNVVGEKDHFYLEGIGNVYGQYDLDTNSLLITESGDAFVHEILHRWDFYKNYNKAMKDDPDHVGWNDNGFYTLDNAYAMKVVPFGI